jgi:hypothetical protein
MSSSRRPRVAASRPPPAGRRGARRSRSRRACWASPSRRALPIPHTIGAAHPGAACIAPRRSARAPFSRRGSRAFRRHAGKRRAAGVPPQPAEPTRVAGDHGRPRCEAARQAGYQDGYRDGMVALEELQAELRPAGDGQLGALLQAWTPSSTPCTQLAAVVAPRAVQLARQVVRSELQQRARRIVAGGGARRWNAVLLSARHITVHVHPQDLPLVAEGARKCWPPAARA